MSPRPITIAEAAKAANCAKSFIGKLVKAGKLPGTQENGPKGHWLINMNKADVKAYVATHHPRAGYKKDGSTKAKAEAAKKSKNTSPLQELLVWAQIKPSARTLLMAIHDKYTEDELALLLEL